MKAGWNRLVLAQFLFLWIGISFFAWATLRDSCRFDLSLPLGGLAGNVQNHEIAGGVLKVRADANAGRLELSYRRNQPWLPAICLGGLAALLSAVALRKTHARSVVDESRNFRASARRAGRVRAHPLYDRFLAENPNVNVEDNEQVFQHFTRWWFDAKEADFDQRPVAASEDS